MSKERKQLVINVSVTFVEAVIAYLVSTGNMEFTKVTLAGAAGAGVSVVYNTVIKPYFKRRKDRKL